MSNLNFTQLQKEITEWTTVTFAEKQTVSSILHHLIKEVKEVMEDPSDIEEYADCQILLMDAALRSGFNMDDIYFAVISKLKKNKLREWGNPDKNGVIEHIRK